jgi:hypothetical protein
MAAQLKKLCDEVRTRTGRMKELVRSIDDAPVNELGGRIDQLSAEIELLRESADEACPE